MPAQEETYYNQRVLHIVFSVSSMLVFGSIIWMIGRDHMREWRVVQREFIRFDAAKTRRDMQAAHLLASRQELEKLQAQANEARRKVRAQVSRIQDDINRLLGKVQRADEELWFRKADRDSAQSKYTIAVGENRPDEARLYLDQVLRLEEEVQRARATSEALHDQLQTLERKKAALLDPVTRIEKQIAAKERELERLEHKKWTIYSTLRDLPILDAFAAATRIEQFVSDELGINYAFKDVPRFDRCPTCHKGIDAVTREGKPAYDWQTVKKLSSSKYRRAFLTHPRPELFCGPASPHPRQRFGCTICHEGQGTGTTFVFTSHSPDSIQQRDQWIKRYDWREVHHWPYKMLRRRFIEASCLKCHPHVSDLEKSRFGNAAPKLVRGYYLIRRYGCFGCHPIDGYHQGRLIGPDLRLEPQPGDQRPANDAGIPGKMRKVGPSLNRISEKMPPDWTRRWIKKPKAFHPNARMPQYYGLTNNDGKHAGSNPDDPALSDVEIVAITKYLYNASREYLRGAELIEKAKRSQGALSEEETKELEGIKAHLVLGEGAPLKPSPAIDPESPEQTARGRELFLTRGCLACHSHQAVPPDRFPQATADFGPDLSNLGAKLRDQQGRPNTRWLFNWLKNPDGHSRRTTMPNLYLNDDEAAAISAWLLSFNGPWPEEVPAPKVDSDLVDRLVTMHLQGSMTLRETEQAVRHGIPAERLDSVPADARLLAAPVDEEKKLMFLGRKTISRLGCYGCHDIPGFETAKPIGTALKDWGQKARLDPDKLFFEHIVDFLEHEVPDDQKGADFELFLEGMKEQKGESFLWQKLRDPRSYDYKRRVAWLDRLRMPRFPFADDPEQVEAVMTFVLGLVANTSIPPYYRNLPAGQELARIEGTRLVHQFNCTGCHVFRMPQYVFDPAKVDLPSPAVLQHDKEFDLVRQWQRARAGDARLAGTDLVSVSGMLLGPDMPPLSPPSELTEDDIVAIELWEPVRIGESYYMVGDRIAFDDARLLDLSRSQPAEGGGFAELLVARLAQAAGKQPRELWYRAPPPLVGEGAKVQPAWLHRFLLNPFRIRPAVTVRMPKFNMSSGEAATLAGFFAAVDGADYPYCPVPQRDENYLKQRERERPNYLTDAWKLLTVQSQEAKLCASCHNVGRVVAGGLPEERGPNLWLTPERFRPDWLLQWLAAPARTLPYTGMPSNFVKGQPQYQDQFAGSSLEQLTAVRDALVNYLRVQQAVIGGGPRTQQTTGGN